MTADETVAKALEDAVGILLLGLFDGSKNLLGNLRAIHVVSSPSSS